MLLKLTNNCTKNELTFDVFDKELSKMFYVVNITLPSDIDDGEYSYFLYDGEELKAQGLVQIGDYKAEKKEYKAEIKDGYVQYNG